MNDAIDSSLCSIHYASIADAVVLVHQLGLGTLFTKLDLRKVYQVVPVHIDNHALLGIN